MIYRYLPYRLELRAPAVLAAFGGDPSSTETLPLVPGGTVRGAVARALGPHPDRDELDTLVLGEEVRYLNAYPAAGRRRCLPLPVSLRRYKNGDHLNHVDLAWFDGEPPDHEVDGHWPGEQLDTAAAEFATLGAATLTAVEVHRSARLHHQRDLRAGRAWTETVGGREVAHGALFAYESLDAGQELCGAMLLRGADEQAIGQRAERIKGLLGGSLLLGRSRRAGYGGDAAITWEQLRQREVAGPSVLNGGVPAEGSFRLLLTAAYVGRHPQTGQPDPARLPFEVEDLLGGRARVERVRWAFTTVGGYNRTWALPVPQVPAAAAGSVLVLRAREPLPLADLLALEHEGLGERRAEGFGRLVLLPEAAEQVVVGEPIRPIGPAKPAGDPPELVRQIERSLTERRVRQEVARVAASIARSADERTLPSNSLIGHLRVPLRSDPTAALERLHGWVDRDPDGGGLRRPARDQLETCRVRVGDHWSSLREWLAQMTTRTVPDGLPTLLGHRAVAQRAQLISEASALGALAQRSTWQRATLVDAVLAAMAERNRARATPPDGGRGNEGSDGAGS
jgi:CRISPR-associated protein Csx10